MFRIRQALTSEPFGRHRYGNTEAESVQSQRLFAIVDFASNCVHIETHETEREEGRYSGDGGGGGGDQSGSKQMHHGSGHLCLYRGREIHFLLL